MKSLVYHNIYFWIQIFENIDFYWFVGKRAIEALLADGRRLAESMSGPEKQELLDTIANIERLTKQLEDLKKAGKVIY